MISDTVLYAIDIMNMINLDFPFSNVLVYYDEVAESYIVSIDDKETFHSEEYLALILKIKIEFLWAKGLYNFLFSYEEEAASTYVKVTTYKNTKISITTAGFEYTPYSLKGNNIIPKHSLPLAA